MKSIFGLGIKQTDYEILKFIDDEDIFNMCLVNREFNNFFKNEDFWLSRFFQLYSSYLKKIDINKYRGKLLWKEYYIEIKTHLKYKYPYYKSALAFSDGRVDIMLLLSGIKKIENVKKFIHTIDNKKIIYFTRDGTINGIKEGIYTIIDNQTNTRTEKMYNEDKLIKEIISVNNIIKYYNKYDCYGCLISQTTWNKKGIKILKEKYNSNFKNIKSWYSDGKIKKIGKYYRNKTEGPWKRDGEWKIYDKNGKLTTIKYSKGNKYFQYEINN